MSSLLEQKEVAIKNYKLTQDAEFKKAQSLIDAAFEDIDQYKTHRRKKKSGGYRVINEPPDAVKKVQQKLLKNFFYRLLKRTEYYHPSEKYFSSKGLQQRKMKLSQVFYGNPLQYAIEKEIHGGIIKRSVKTALETHAVRSSKKSHYRFLLKTDLKNAYPSVSAQTLERMLYEMLLDDCKRSFVTYQRSQFMKHRFELVSEIKTLVGEKPTNTEALLEWSEKVNQWLIQKGFYEAILPDELDALLVKEDEVKIEYEYGYGGQRWPKKIFHKNPDFPKYSFFPAFRYREFREFVRSEARKTQTFECSEIPVVLKYFTSWICRICCYEGVLPQGAPTSSFLLSFVLSCTGVVKKILSIKGISNVSIYVDDIVITSMKRFNKETLQEVKDVIENTGIFTLNPKKTSLYDLKRGAATVLGAKIVYRPLTQREVSNAQQFPEVMPRYIVEAVKEGRNWFSTTVTLSKKKQKQYRAFLHRVITGKGNENDFRKAQGYVGHLVSIYGHYEGYLAYPASLKKVMKEYKNFLRKRKYPDWEPLDD